MTTMSRSITIALGQFKEAIEGRFKRFPAISFGGNSEAPGVVPVDYSGDGAPTEALPPGSVYRQRDGTDVTTLWVMVGTTWTAIGAAGGAGVFTDLTATGNTILGNATSDTITATGRFASALVPTADDTHDLGTSLLEWQDAWFDGTVNIDALVADTADINGGTVDGAVIGGSSAAAGSFTTLLGTVVTASTSLVTPLLDMSGLLTGVGKWLLTNNLAIAARIADGVGDFITFQSTTAARFVKFARPWMDATATTVNMAGAAHALVWGTAGAAQTSVTSRIIAVTAGAGVPTLTPPDVTVGDGVELTILNASSTTFLVAGAATHRVYQNGSVTLVSTAGFWLLKNQVGHLKAGTITVSLGASSGTATIQGGGGTDWDGKPAIAQAKTIDATFLHPLGVEISGGVLTVTGTGAATGAVDVYYVINGA